MEINSLFKAKQSIQAFVNYNKCDKHCELPNHVTCCYRPCISRNKEKLAYSIEDVINGIEYILNYFEVKIYDHYHEDEIKYIESISVLDDKSSAFM